MIGFAKKRIGPGVRAALALTAVAIGARCDSLLEVAADPNAINAEGVGGEASYQARTIGTVSDFAAGMGSGIVYGGLFTDVLVWGGSFVRRDEIDRRTIDPTNDVVANEPYTALQIAAKTSKDLQREILDGSFPSFVEDPENSEDLAQVSLVSGYSRLLLTDLFCTLAFDNTGPELTSADVYGLAIQDFTRAINAAGADEEVRNAALVGRARAQLQLGERAAALSDAGLVPEGFEYVLEYSGNGGRETNEIYTYTWGNRRLVVGPRFRQPTIDDTDILDPRVKVEYTGGASFSGNVPHWAPTEHESPSSPVRIASWEEAQFIIAELEGGAVATGIINDLRARHGVGVVFNADGSATDQEILRKVVDEKSRTLLFGGTRMADMRRYLERYAIDLFPTGERYGDQTCMPLPNKERQNNPGLQG